MSVEERRIRRLTQPAWWGLPTRNSLDRPQSAPQSHIRMRASISLFRSMALVFGLIHIGGCPRQRGYYGRAADCTSLCMPFCSHCVYLPTTILPRATDSCVQRSACIVSSGQPIIAWSFTFPTVIGSDCCDDRDLRLKILSRFGLKRTRKRPISS
jgi:hypothetical protein